MHHGLNLRIPAHIWLLHRLFLDAINQDAREWATAWNAHKIELRGEPWGLGRHSPNDFFFFQYVGRWAEGGDYSVSTP